MSNTTDLTPQSVGITLMLTFQEALGVATDRLRAGRLDEAQPIYEALLQCAPRHADVLGQLGFLHYQRENHERALELMRTALEYTPDSPGLWNNVGNVLSVMDRPDEAADAFERSLALADNAHAHSNLARIWRGRSDWPRSEAAARRALALSPEAGESWHSLALALLGQSRYPEAAEAAVHGMPMIPPRIRNRDFYARLLLINGQPEQALKVYEAWVAADPDNPYPRHHLAACSGRDVPERASDAYIEKTFDRFAASFDDQLAKLDYRAPEFVAEALALALPAPARALDIADLGCGTGLCGPLVRPWARRLVGCDLSGAMLEKAAQREAYDELLKIELVQFLEARAGAFDALVAADTLIYFGDLTQVAQAAGRALRPGGVLVVTIEAMADERAGHVELNTGGRYAHKLAYLTETFAAAGLATRAALPVVLRMENFVSVDGWVVTAVRGG